MRQFRRPEIEAAAIVEDLLTIARGVATTKEPLSLNELINEYLNSPEFKKLKQFHPTVKINTNLDSSLLNIRGSYAHVRKGGDEPGVKCRGSY